MEELTQEEIEKRKKERERVKKWRENPANREKIRLSARKWREKNLEKSLAITREWRLKHPEYERERYDSIVSEQRKRTRKQKKQFAEDMKRLAESLKESEEPSLPIHLVEQSIGVVPTQDENLDLDSLYEDNNSVLTKRKRGGFKRAKNLIRKADLNLCRFKRKTKRRICK